MPLLHNDVFNTLHKYHAVTTAAQREELIKKLLVAPSFAFDTETTSKIWYKAEIVGMSFSIEPHIAYYVTIPADYTQAKAILEEFNQIFQDSAKELIGHNLKYDIHIITDCYGIEIKCKLYDTMLAHYCLMSHEKSKKDWIAANYLHYDCIPIESLIGKKPSKKSKRKQRSMRDVPLAEIVQYAAEDADITLQLKHYLNKKIINEKQEKLFQTLEMPLLPVLLNIEANGVRFDCEGLQAYSEALKPDLHNAEKSVYAHAGKVFKITSNPQLAQVLFKDLKLPYKGKFTSTGKQSVKEDILLKLKNTHPIIEQILLYKKIRKIQTHFIPNLIDNINPATGRVHTSLNQTFTITGRLTAKEPNLQQLPRKFGKQIRSYLVPENEDYLIMAADFSQIELRVLAEFCGDSKMIEEFRSGADIHWNTALLMHGNTIESLPEKERKDIRDQIKVISFGLIYGKHYTTLAKELSIDESEAYELTRTYIDTYPKVATYLNECKRKARGLGYAESMKGRKVYIPAIKSKDFFKKNHAENLAVNAPIQGSAAELMKIAMINLHSEFIKRKLKSMLILQIHDEIVIDLYKPEEQEVRTLVKKKWKQPFP